MTEYFDIRCGDDVDRFARDVRPFEVLSQDVYHWLITERGSLILDPDWGFGLNSYIGKPLPSTLAKDIEEGLVREDDRISEARCTIARVNGEEESYRLDLQAEVEDGFLAIALELTPDGIAKVAA